MRAEHDRLMEPVEHAARRIPVAFLESHPGLSLACLFVLVVVVKLPTLTTPAYWDEMAWLGQAEWLSNASLLRALPGLHVSLAVLYKVFGPSRSLAHLVIVCFGALGVCSTYLLGRLLYDSATGWLAALFLLLSPIYLAQSGMFLADVPVAALAVTCTYLALRERYLPYLVCATYMVLIKETSIALIAVLVVYRCLVNRPRTRSQLASTLKYAAPLVAIGAFILLQRLTTGHFFTIYEFDFDLFVLSEDAVRRQFVRVNEWIFIEQLRWVLTVLIAADLLWNRGIRVRRDVWLVLLIIAASGYSFSVLYFLPRYLLPTLPFFFILGAHSLMKLVPSSPARMVVGAVAVTTMAWSLATQSFIGNSEFNLRYLDAVAVHTEMARYIETNHRAERVLTTFPHDKELRNPLLGYVDRPLDTSPIEAGEGGDTGLILVSTLSESRNVLEKMASDERLRVIKRVEKGTVAAVLYGRGGRN